MLTSLDPVVRKNIADLILPCLPYLDIFLPNNDESVHITGISDPKKQLEFYQERGAGIVGIKMGEKGVLISDGNECFHMGVYQVPVVDTCGAGDAFIAGFIYGVLQKWGLRRTAEFASATAAFCIQSIGTTTAVPSAIEVSNFMSKNKSPEVCGY